MPKSCESSSQNKPFSKYKNLLANTTVITPPPPPQKKSLIILIIMLGIKIGCGENQTQDTFFTSNFSHHISMWMNLYSEDPSRFLKIIFKDHIYYTVRVVLRCSTAGGKTTAGLTCSAYLRFPAKYSFLKTTFATLWGWC